MKAEFKDLKKLGGKPKWYGRVGIPRYCEFHPSRFGYIYADEVVLIRIGCQACNKHFRVAIFSDRLKDLDTDINSYREAIDEGHKGWLHYGDPPYHDCVGDSMSSNPEEILQFWVREKSEWKRLEKYEGIELLPYG